MTLSHLLSRIPPSVFWHLLSWGRPIFSNILLWFLLVRPLRPSRPWRILLALLLVLDAAQAPILRYLGGSPFMPDIPGPLLVALHLLRGLATLTFLELLILWPILVLGRLVSRRPGRLPRTGGTGAPPVHPRMENDCVAPSPSSSCARTGGGARPPSAARSAQENRLLKPRLLLVLLLANAALLATAFTSALLPPRVTVLEVPIPGLPPALDGYRILHITDIHADPINGAWRTRAIVRRANAAAPDLVCITGDFADGPCARLAPALAPLADLRAPDGIYACTGNHEYYPPSANSGWPAFFASLDIRFPSTPALIPHASSLLAVASLPDNAPPGAPLPPLPGDFNLYLKHRPVDLAPLAAAGAHLILSGHTHGGQFPPLTLLVAAANEGHLSGLYPIAPRTLLHVSPGASQWNGLPYRFLRPSELPLLVLRPAA